ncbi:MAG: SusD/RagB family nutrient-binding outer membrane lipoprotein [Bacteroidota bacterium]
MKKLFLFALIAWSLWGCETFEELNTNRNEPESVSGDLALPTVIFELSNFVVNQSYWFGENVSQYTATYEQRAYDEYNWTSDGTYWALYDIIQDAQVVGDFGKENELVNYEAIAIILKAYMFSLITDVYGDIPFTEANQAAAGIIAPAYDTQESIYQALLAQLEAANSMIDTDGTVNGDILFQGDMLRWKQFANSLRVRLLMRASSVQNVGAALTSLLNAPDTYPMFASTDDEAAYQYSGALPDISPYSNGVGRLYNYFLGVPTTHFVRELQTNDDPRIHEWLGVSADAGAFVGVVPGLNLSEVGRPNEFASKDTSFFLEPAKIKGIFMTYAELNFLLSEAAMEGFITGDPAEYYARGVQASFDQWGVSMPADFTSTTAPYSQENLYTQKWLALYHCGAQGWLDWKRTGQPDFIQAGPGTRNGGQVPVRLMYPALEQSVNASNYETAASRIGGDNINSRVWWDN